MKQNSKAKEKDIRLEVVCPDKDDRLCKFSCGCIIVREVEKNICEAKSKMGTGCVLLINHKEQHFDGVWTRW